jgi:hypothetical protein
MFASRCYTLSSFSRRSLRQRVYVTHQQQQQQHSAATERAPPTPTKKKTTPTKTSLPSKGEKQQPPSGSTETQSRPSVASPRQQAKYIKEVTRGAITNKTQSRQYATQGLWTGTEHDIGVGNIFDPVSCCQLFTIQSEPSFFKIL